MKIEKQGFTQNDESASMAQRHERENAMALLKLLTLSEIEKSEGKVVSKEQLLDGLDL